MWICHASLVIPSAKLGRQAVQRGGVMRASDPLGCEESDTKKRGSSNVTSLFMND